MHFAALPVRVSCKKNKANLTDFQKKTFLYTSKQELEQTSIEKDMELQTHTDTAYRQLLPAEIRQLEQQGCTAENWQLIEVHPDIDLRHLAYVHFPAPTVSGISKDRHAAGRNHVPYGYPPCHAALYHRGRRLSDSPRPWVYRPLRHRPRLHHPPYGHHCHDRPLFFRERYGTPCHERKRRTGHPHSRPPVGTGSVHAGHVPPRCLVDAKPPPVGFGLRRTANRQPRQDRRRHTDTPLRPDPQREKSGLAAIWKVPSGWKTARYAAIRTPLPSWATWSSPVISSCKPAAMSPTARRSPVAM